MLRDSDSTLSGHPYVAFSDTSSMPMTSFGVPSLI